MAGQKEYFDKNSIRPDFLDSKNSIDPAKSNPSSPKETLETIETEASQAPRSTEGQKLESNPTPAKSLYVGQTHRQNHSQSRFKSAPKSTSRFSKNSSLAQKSKGFSGSKLLYFSPALLLVVVIAVFVFLAFGATSFLGPHIEHLFTESTNTDYTAHNLRSNEVMTEILSGAEEMPDYLKERLEKKGVTVNNDNTLVYNGTVITAENFKSTYNNDANFREAITDARRGRVATFFDSAAEEFYKKLGLSRDVLHDYQTTGDAAADSAEYDKIMTEYFDVESNSTIETAAAKTSTDSDGNQTTSIAQLGSTSSNTAGGTTITTGNSTPSADAKTRASQFLDSVGNIVESSSVDCATSATGDLVATAVASNAKYTYANTFMTIMESISKAMAGEGEQSGINSVLNWFTRSATTTVHDPITGAESEVTGTPLEAQSVRSVLSGIPIDQNKTKSYSLERAFVSTDAVLKNPVTCSTDAENGIGLSLNAKGTPGSSFIKTVIGGLLDSVGAGVKITASSTLSLLIPSVSDVLYSNAYTDSAQGVSGGELFGMGAANVNQLAAQQNSGATGASKEQVLAYNHANNTTIAQQAEIDRKNHSPFDASNSNTFLGSIASSLLPLTSSTNTSLASSSTFATDSASTLASGKLASSASTLSSVTASALANISSTYADGENTSYLTTFGDDCQKSNGIGAVSNVYCNMIAVNDLSIIDIPESDPQYQKVISESVDIIDGQEVVREGSPLADFITYWTGRYSMPGIYDANIASACEESRTGNIPILSSIIAMLGPVSEYCQSVADGSRYVNSDSNPYWQTEKYHQLWVLNTRVKENLGFYKNSKSPLATDGSTGLSTSEPLATNSDKVNPLTAFREKYEAEHPLDNSRAGYLARISGLTKYDAETVIAIFDYNQRIANYHPEDAYQFGTRAGSGRDISNNPTADVLLAASQTDELTALYEKASNAIIIDPASISMVRHEEITA